MFKIKHPANLFYYRSLHSLFATGESQKETKYFKVFIIFGTELE